MIIEDKIYGNLFIEDPVVGEIIQSAPVQRLHHLAQHGASIQRKPHLDTTRFEHSVGVFYLLQTWDAPIEEQIAGLLHDVNHLAFSHVIDFVFGSDKQEFAEQFHRQVIMNSDIPDILRRYGIDPEPIIAFKDFPLLEQSLPDLCADRFDYFLRDTVADGNMTVEEGLSILDDVRILDGSVIAFETEDVARDMAERFRHQNTSLWASPLDMTLFTLLAQAIRISLDKKVIDMKDLFGTDMEVWNKMYSKGPKEVQALLNLIKRANVQMVEEGQPYDYHVKSKIRLVDPLVIVGDSVERLSEIDGEFAVATADYMNAHAPGCFVKIV